MTLPNEAVAGARTLVADGRPVDAIRLLTEANRVARSDALEKLLVEMRHESFATLDRRPPVPVPDKIVADPTYDARGALPELRPADLTVATLREGLSRHGCVLVRGLVPPERVDALVAGIDRALDACDASLAGADEAETMPWFAPFRPTGGNYRVGGRRNWVRASGGVWTADSPRMLFELMEVVDETGVGDLIAAHLGERPALSANKCTLRRVPIDTNTDWHQDGAFLGEGARTIDLWLSLSHCGRDAPGLDIVPRRIDHVVQTGTEGAFFDWSVSPAVVDDVAGETPVIRPEFAPGDALLFDHLLLHRTAAGPEMTRERYAIETWFFAPSAYPDGQIPLVY
jgi:hypothetical protein